MTLWEVLSSSRHTCEMKFTVMHLTFEAGDPATCCRCRGEQWAREKNSELRARSECLKEETPQDFKDGWFTGVMSVVHDDLGVPEDEIRREK